jgi:PPOX class F420-dependent enzyme/OxyR family protein/uncharacterized protein (TIGR02246 family)
MPIDVFDASHAAYLRDKQRGHLATIAPNGTPQNKPVSFRYNDELQTIEIPGINMDRSAKFHNIAMRPGVAFTVDDTPDAHAGTEGVRFMEIRGTAEQVELELPPMPGTSRWIIRITPRRVVSWNVGGPGLHSADLPGGGLSASSVRPAIGLTGTAAARGQTAVERQVAELQAGLHDQDAELYNRHFAGDVIWGSPYGATVEGYDSLHAIHRRLHAANDRGDSRYEIVRVLCPTPDVALAQVRRTALDDNGEPIPSLEGEPRFSEMALYVLVRRAGSWWLAAGQNTIVIADRGALAQESAS